MDNTGNRALSLIAELEQAFKNDNFDDVYGNNQSLVEELIFSDLLPEEYAQRLLRLKTLFFMKQEAFSEALLQLNVVLVNQDHRLFCQTLEFYKLLFIKYDILFAQSAYLEAYNFLFEIKDFFEDEDFLNLENHQQIQKEWQIKAAIISHFNKKNESYELFKAYFNDMEQPLQLDNRSQQLFIVYGNECFRQQKYPEAISVFTKLLALDLEPNFRQEIRMMLLLSNIVLDQTLNTLSANNYLPAFTDNHSSLSVNAPTPSDERVEHNEHNKKESMLKN